MRAVLPNAAGVVLLGVAALFWSPDHLRTSTTSDPRGGEVQTLTSLSPAITPGDAKVKAGSPASVVVTIYGPDYAQPYESCTFWADPVGGTAPYSYQWSVNGRLVGDDSWELVYSNRGGSFTVNVVVTDDTGAKGSASHYVPVSSGSYSCYY
ncbi:MAG TPA: PKD domain-containing protein [Longimicrobium sp.]|nr:PKD domain-containing protein [Longimicrobium sp.]